MKSLAVASLLLQLLPTIVYLGFVIPTLPVVTCFVVPAVPGTLAQQTTPPFSTVCSSTSNNNDAMVSSVKWFQHELSITAPSRGCHLITREVQKAIKADLAQINIGMCNLFVQHTSASLTLNENADPDVRRDLETALNKIVPASWNHDGTFRHTMEGDDDMPVRCF